MSSVVVTRPVRRRPRFHELTVVEVAPANADASAVAVTFAVPPQLRGEYEYRPGQHVTVRKSDIRRSYSICSPPSLLADEGLLRVGIKEIPGGAFSSFAVSSLREGDVVEVMAPIGHFTTELDPVRSRHYAAVVAGSGITPVLSLVAAALETEPQSRFTVLFGNRHARSVMFADELADLKDRWPSRLQLVHTLSREPMESELLSGRMDPARLQRLLAAFVPVDTVDEWFLCGPFGLVIGAQRTLKELGVRDGGVHLELFHAEDTPVAGSATAPEAGGAGTADVTIMLDGRATSFTMGADERVLDAALKVRGELPYACKGGVCSTCRAKVVDGEVRMARNYALEPDELAAGFVLTCQSSPVSDKVTIDYDA